MSAELFQFNPEAFKQLIKDALIELREADADALKTEADLLREINAKVYVTVLEACRLLRCSDTHLYRKITAARGGAPDLIPYLEKERSGVYVFPREELINWARGNPSDAQEDARER
ncbi:MAG: hypothetical protein WCD76_02605, partial [Pyrinomonadaceae bacterium]